MGKNKSCTQYLTICKLESCKGHLQKVIQFTLAKRKHKLQHTEIVFLMQDLIQTNPGIFRWIMFKTIGRKYFAYLTFLSQISVLDVHFDSFY